LAVNTVFLVKLIDIGGLGGRAAELKKAKGMAVILLQYYQLLANQLGVSNYPSVRSALARLRFETESSSTAEETIGALLHHGSLVYDAILNEAKNHHLREVVNLIASDSKVRVFDGVAEIVIRRAEDGSRVEVEAPRGLLSGETISKIEEIPLFRQISSTFRFEVSQGKVVVLTEDMLKSRLDSLKGEVMSLKSRLDTLASLAGFAPLEGEGIILKVYDAKKKEGEAHIIHDSDLRDIVNELFAAGALGIQVGGERLVVQSSIRCVGPVILVNHRPIPVDPVIIKAVGNPEVLSSALRLIEKSLEFFGIRIEVEKSEKVSLVGYRD